MGEREGVGGDFLERVAARCQKSSNLEKSSKGSEPMVEGVKARGGRSESDKSITFAASWGCGLGAGFGASLGSAFAFGAGAFGAGAFGAGGAG